MKSADAAFLTVVTAVAAAAILGGAFYPGQRIVVGLAFAVGLGLGVLSGIGRLAVEERVLFGFLAWGVVTVVVASSAPLAGREVLTTWLVASMVWLVARRVRPRAGESSPVRPWSSLPALFSRLWAAAACASAGCWRTPI